jgi:hypothetical protein
MGEIDGEDEGAIHPELGPKRRKHYRASKCARRPSRYPAWRSGVP